MSANGEFVALSIAKALKIHLLKLHLLESLLMSS
jgi:hypothetical protein